MRNVIVVMAGCCLMNLAALADETLHVLPQTIDGAPASEMMSRYLRRQAGQRFEQWRQRYEELKTPEQIAAYQKNLREKFLEAIGGLPAKTPLNPRVTGVVVRDGYRVVD